MNLLCQLMDNMDNMKNMRKPGYKGHLQKSITLIYRYKTSLAHLQNNSQYNHNRINKDLNLLSPRRAKSSINNRKILRSKGKTHSIIT
jgi:hypothetical protein